MSEFLPGSEYGPVPMEVSESASESPCLRQLLNLSVSMQAVVELDRIVDELNDAEVSFEVSDSHVSAQLECQVDDCTVRCEISHNQRRTTVNSVVIVPDQSVALKDCIIP
jgi:hypothetical protein